MVERIHRGARDGLGAWAHTLGLIFNFLNHDDAAANPALLCTHNDFGAAQGIEARAPLKTAPRLSRAIEILRADVPTLAEDRYLAPDLAKAAGLVRGGALLEVLE